MLNPTKPASYATLPTKSAAEKGRELLSRPTVKVALSWCGMCGSDIPRRQNRGKGQQPKDDENRRLCAIVACVALVVEEEKWAMSAA